MDGVDALDPHGRKQFANDAGGRPDTGPSCSAADVDSLRSAAGGAFAAVSKTPRQSPFPPASETVGQPVRGIVNSTREFD